MTSTLEVTRHAYPPKVRTLTVARTETLSPTMRRFVLTGDELEPEFPFPRLTTATHVKVVVPQETTGVLEMPTLGPLGLAAPDGVELAIRDYTVRRFDSDARLLTLDFVLHEHGPAGRWAIGASDGDELGVLGPRGYTIYPAGFDRYVLGADETGLPALERWLEEAPAEAHIDAFVVAPEGGQRALPEHPNLTVQWIDGSGAGELARALVDATPGGDVRTYLWAAGESGIVGPLRQHLRTSEFTQTHFEVSGYWRAGRAGSGDHHEARS
ncbi:siderophore-interacting protein [Amycolatopsis sp. GM8]|uniref:siderophore-interacting protein n=1 Tax=Amycolatopsis sp. GM8 TaxID=2896530 RepID=UPI001F3A45C6|nr:siderophore-interacting protein [Amycolatopsis sp. GM8]